MTKKKQRRMIAKILTGCAILLLSACAGFSATSQTLPTDLPAAYLSEAPQSKQMLLVLDKTFLFFPRAKIYVLEKKDIQWQCVFDPIPAAIGRNGFAPKGEKREGDGKTPSGLYRLGTAFGYEERINTKMPYRRALTDDLWVDDPESPDYNHWVKSSETAATSFEKMKRDDDLYQYGVVIEYNTDPVVKNWGSAIFLHVRDGAWSTTAGCVAVSEEDILKILGWLDPEAHPVIVLNPETVEKEDP